MEHGIKHQQGSRLIDLVAQEAQKSLISKRLRGLSWEEGPSSRPPKDQGDVEFVFLSSRGGLGRAPSEGLHFRLCVRGA